MFVICGDYLIEKKYHAVDVELSWKAIWSIYTSTSVQLDYENNLFIPADFLIALISQTQNKNKLSKSQTWDLNPLTTYPLIT